MYVFQNIAQGIGNSDKGNLITMASFLLKPKQSTGKRKLASVYKLFDLQGM